MRLPESRGPSGAAGTIEEIHDVRVSNHEEPSGAVAIARHYIRDVIYGANDGILTTFAVVSAVTGGALTARAVLIVGVANLCADGLSMGVGNYLSIRSNESALAAQGRPEQEASPAGHGLATFLAFAAAGAVPLLPFLVSNLGQPFALSVLLTFVTLFAVGASGRRLLPTGGPAPGPRCCSSVPSLPRQRTEAAPWSRR